MKNKLKETIGSFLFIVAILLTISLVVLIPVLDMLLLGAMIAYGIRPIANNIQSKIKFSSISTIISIILVVIPLILLFAYTISVIMGLSHSFISSSHSSLDLNQSANIINSYLPPEMQSSASAITSLINQIINDGLKMVFSYLVDFIKSLPMVMLQVFILLFSIFYFVRDGHKVKEYVTPLIPEEKHELFSHMIIEIKIVLKSVFYGHFLTGVVVGAIGAIGFFLLGYEYVLFLGILTGISQLIPVVGPWAVYMVLFITDVLSGNYIRAILVLFFGFGLSLSDAYIRPALTSKYVDIHPLILLVGFLSGPLIFGLVGFILGPLILGITYAVVKAYKNNREMSYQKNSKKIRTNKIKITPK